jgi:uncharacterized protein YjiS (DUF1127 family)
MFLKLTAVAAKPHLQVSQLWSAIAVHFRSCKQRSHDSRILSHMNDHNLRDLGLTLTQNEISRRPY